MYKEMNQILQFIEEHLHETITLQDLSHLTHYSESHISRNFNKIIGMSISEYIMKRRLSNASYMLYHTAKSIQYISDIMGFSSTKYFSTMFKKEFGITPSASRSKKHVLHLFPKRILTKGEPNMSKKDESVFEVKVEEVDGELELSISTECNEADTTIEATYDEGTVVIQKTEK